MRILMLACLALIPAALSAETRAARPEVERRVPADESLEIGEYGALGVPDPQNSWAVDQYIEALRSLGALERRTLPRVDSDRSGLLFERLVITHLSVPDIVVSRVSAQGEAVPTLTDLYSPTADDGLLFDRELVSIRSAELRSVISDAPTQADVSEAESVAARLYEMSDAKGRRQHAQQLLEYSKVLQQSSEAIRIRFARLLHVASIPMAADGARADLVAALSEYVPAAEGRLTAEDRLMLTAELKALGRLEANTAIKGELMRLASLLQEDRTSP